MGKSGKLTFQPITTLLYEDYLYSVNVTAQTKHHHYVETSLYKDVSTFVAQAYCGSISSKCGCIHIFGPDWYLLGLAECECIHIFWPRLVFVRVSGMWIRHFIRMYPHFWPRLVFLGVSGMYIERCIHIPLTLTNTSLGQKCGYIRIYRCIHISLTLTNTSLGQKCGYIRI